MALSKAAIEMLRRRISNWNNKHPVDLVWRQHFKIPFGSQEHLESDIFQQQMWYEEHIELEKLREEHQKKLEEDPNYLEEIKTGKPVEVDMVSEVPMTQDEIEEEFMKMNIAELNKQYGRELTPEEKEANRNSE